MPKTTQLQIRVSPAQKAAIRRQARRAGLGMSDWVLSKVLPPAGDVFQDLVRALARADEPGYPLAELNDLLARLSAVELVRAVAEPPRARLERYHECYVAAMVELAAARKGTDAPAWTREVPPLEEPVFGSPLMSHRLHLLTHSPPPFRRRNIFIDASVGNRV